MNKDSDSKHNIQDKDIASLFDKQNITVPASLDENILKASRQVQPEGARLKRHKKYTSWLATAAVLALAITLGPLLLNEPESQPQQEETLLSLEKKLFENNEGKPLNFDLVIDEKPKPVSVEKATRNDILLDIQTENSRFESLSSVLAPQNDMSIVQTLSDDNKGNYRHLPASWKKRIEDLVAAKRYDMARVEYDLFRKKHPTYRLDIEIPSH